MKVKDAKHHRNGVTGDCFYVAVVEDLFPDDVPGGEFLVTWMYDTNENGELKFTDTTRVAVLLLEDGKPNLHECWRGDRTPPEVLEAIAGLVREGIK